MDSLEDSFEKRVVFAVDFVSDNDVIELHSSSIQFSSENACLLQEDVWSGPTSQRVGGCRGKVLDVQSSSAAAGNLYPFQNERTLRRVSAIFLCLVKPLVNNWNDFVPPLRAINRFSLLIEQYRSALMVTSTFLALAPYRHALQSILKNCRHKFRNKKNSAKVSNAVFVTKQNKMFLRAASVKKMNEHRF
uniref:Ras-GEF domain-containing protein n=1 Tax=Ascaris lumbricoides TaxID=6252 RepID=A0A0M3I550_ASCLU